MNLRCGHFDPTLSKEGKQIVEPQGFKLVESGLVGRSETGFVFQNVKYPAKDLIAHMADLGHSSRTIDVLKIDIERNDYAALSLTHVGDAWVRIASSSALSLPRERLRNSKQRAPLAL